MPCITCIWYSDGFGDEERGAGWCYADEFYTDADHTCPFWQKSLRNEPLLGPDGEVISGGDRK